MSFLTKNCNIEIHCLRDIFSVFVSPSGWRDFLRECAAWPPANINYKHDNEDTILVCIKVMIILTSILFFFIERQSNLTETIATHPIVY